MKDSAVTRLVLASTNQGKLAEIAAILGDRFELQARPDEMPATIEDGDSLEANAIKKAIEVVAYTGLAALSDDTGLFVTALAGAPGIMTARFAGEVANDADNRAKLLAEMSQAEDRSAHFRTVLCLAWPDGSSVLAEGRVDGVITSAEIGTNGFGYDSVFVPAGATDSFAQMSSTEKNRYSHRKQALTALSVKLA